MSTVATPAPRLHTGPHIWRREEIEKLISWMEAHQSQLTGKQCDWHKLVKEQVFPSVDHVTLKRIREKITNMRRVWKEARDMMRQYRWGPTAEENDSQINERLERKCAYFWRLEAIWGNNRPGAAAAVNRGPQAGTRPPPAGMGRITAPSTNRPILPAPRSSPEARSSSVSSAGTTYSERLPEVQTPAGLPLQFIPHQGAPRPPVPRPRARESGAVQGIKRALEDAHAGRADREAKRLETEERMRKEDREMEAILRREEMEARLREKREEVEARLREKREKREAMLREKREEREAQHELELKRIRSHGESAVRVAEIQAASTERLARMQWDAMHLLIGVMKSQQQLGALVPDIPPPPPPA